MISTQQDNHNTTFLDKADVGTEICIPPSHAPKITKPKLFLASFGLLFLCGVLFLVSDQIDQTGPTQLAVVNDHQHNNNNNNDLGFNRNFFLQWTQGPKKDPKENSLAGKCVYVTILMTENSFVLGAALLGWSLRHTHTTADLVLLTSTELSPESSAFLSDVGGWTVRFVKPLPSPWTSKQCGRFCDTYTKLRVWEFLDGYHKAVFLDSDAFVVRNIDHLFEYKLRRNQIAAALNQNPTTINSGVFVFVPSKVLFADMVASMGYIEAPLRQSRAPFEFSDQTFIHAYFTPCFLNTTTCRDSSHTNVTILPTVYNLQLHAKPFRTHFDLNQNTTAVFIYHYSNHPKPWACRRSCPVAMDLETMIRIKLLNEKPKSASKVVSDNAPRVGCCDERAKCRWLPITKNVDYCQSSVFRYAHELWLNNQEDVMRTHVIPPQLLAIDEFVEPK